MEHAAQHLRRLLRQVVRVARRPHALLHRNREAGTALGVGACKRERPGEHRIYDYAKAPDVGRGGGVAEVLGGSEHLGCGVHDGAALGVPQEGGVLVDLPESGGQPKIANLDQTVSSEQDVLRLEVAVVDRRGVTVRERRRDLVQVPLGRGLVQGAALGDPVEELTSTAKLHHHEHPLAVQIDESRLQLHDVRMAEAAVCG
mmetsp:Transcript_7073/g.23217  ORF Transcript_7073/g.23217 Transcript_7073/m.23217 type:complete len:201 (+) Transcript_7073:1558-2160(+)